MADFISSGGLVLSDRFQFFVWTLVGCAGFLVLVLSHDPSALKDLPEVPGGFLYLMGISAAGYLGGKVVRLPGPVVTELLVAAVVPEGLAVSMTINIKGENISQNALVNVDGDTLRPDQFSIEVVKLQNQSPDSSFCTEINLVLKDATAYLEGVHTLTLTNKDGQMAASSFPVDPLTIDPNQAFTEGAEPVSVDVSGKNFADGMTAEWTNGAGVVTPIAAPQVQKKSDTKLNLTLTPGPDGIRKLVLISAIKLRTSAKVTIKAVKP